MLDLIFLIKGILLGFSIAIPVGPIGILCIRRTLYFGRASGLVSGLGAALADVLFGIIAACGLTFISDFLLGAKLWLKIGGGCFLLYLALKIFFSKPYSVDRKISHSNLLHDFFSTFFLTITNPLTIVSYLAIFAALGLYQADSFSSVPILISGIFLGSALWWLILSESMNLLRKKINQKVFSWLNRIGACTIATLGLLTIFLY